MADNWALVIGVEAYADPAANLPGTVDDALRFAAWLLRPEGGDVPANRMELLLAPAAGWSMAEAVPTGSPLLGLRPADASEATVVTAVNRIRNRCGGTGERLFVYFSGHGLSGANGDGIAFADFTEELTTRSRTIDSLERIFATVAIRQQFFFIDGCRNPAFGPNILLGGGNEQSLTRAAPPPAQFGMYATLPQQTAQQIAQRGAFTDVLLEGLAGAAGAKQWDGNQRRFTVRFGRLYDHVWATIDARGVQTPTRFGETYGADPVLASFPEDHFAPVTLRVALSPTPALAATAVTVRDLASITRTHPAPIASSPVAFTLPPRPYGISVESKGWLWLKGEREVDLYAPRDVAIELAEDSPTAAPAPTAATFFQATSPPAPPPPAPPMTALPPVGAAVARTSRLRSLASGLGTLAASALGGVLARMLGGGTTRAFITPSIRTPFAQGDSLPQTVFPALGEGAAAPRPVLPGPIVRHGITGPPLPDWLDDIENAAIVANAEDARATVEIADEAGEHVFTGRGRARVPEGPTGFFRARVLTPEGPGPATLIAVQAGEQVRWVELRAPEPASATLRHLLGQAGIAADINGAFVLGRETGPVAAPRLATALALAGAEALSHSVRPPGRVTSLLAPQPFPATAGIMVLLGAEGDKSWPAAVQLALGEAPMPSPDATTGLPALASSAVAAPPGRHVLRVTDGGGPALNLSLPVLADSMTLAILVRDLPGRVGATVHVLERKIIPREQTRRVLDLDLMLRAVAARRPALAQPELDAALTGQPGSALACALAAVVALEQTPAPDLGRAVAQLGQTAPDWPEAHLAAATLAEAQGDATIAAGAYAAALDAGPPLLRAAIAPILAGAARHVPAHPAIEKLQAMAGRIVDPVFTLTVAT